MRRLVTRGRLRACGVALAGIALMGLIVLTALQPVAQSGRLRVDSFALGDGLAARGGWFFDRQSPPDSLHATVHAGHLAAVDQLGADLADAAAELARTGARAGDRSARYGTV